MIVVETGQVTIYDGDDPDLPMWMVFNGTGGGASHNLIVSTGTFCLSAMNGTVFMGALAIYVNFISEYSRGHRSTSGANYWNGPYNGNIAERNAGKGSTKLSDKLIRGGSTDVAMTVLPNAPIDPSTGLPIPTIAIATDGGVSVIKDDGSVVDLNIVGRPYSSVYFSPDNLVWAVENPGTVNYDLLRYFEIPSADITTASSYGPSSTPALFPSNTKGNIFDSFAYGSPVGLSIIDHADGTSAAENGMIAYVSSDYNTGYQHGDIKGAFLSDTDATNITYTTVADDWATAGAWTKQSNITISSTGSGTSGTLSISGANSGSNVYFFNSITVEANTDYVVSVTFGAYNASDFFINTTQYSGSNQVLNIHGLSGLTRGGHFNSGSNTTLYIQGWQFSSTATTITNFVVQKVSEIDRSVNNNPLLVFGTINKSAVATGADLVGYSGFSNSTNYLSQPPNSDLAIGNSDFSSVGWFKKTTSSNTGMIIFANDGSNQVFDVRVHTDMKMLAQITDDGFSTREIVSAQGSTVNDNMWHQYHAVRRNNIMYLYLDGELLGTSASVEANITNSLGVTIGAETLSGNAKAFEGSLALLRISRSAPSPEQIKKIYENERVLFQENAKCTLYGTSDAVTALAYDEATSLLHVGTSSGRSDFSGLKRINNTTTAVATAISASNGLIAEQ